MEERYLPLRIGNSDDYLEVELKNGSVSFVVKSVIGALTVDVDESNILLLIQRLIDYKLKLEWK